MPRPQSTLIATDGNLGLIPASPGLAQIKVGICSQGTVNQLYFPSSKNDLTTVYGTGPAVEAAAFAMDWPGRGAVGMLRVATSTPGSTGGVTKTDSPAAVGTATTIGSSNAALSLVAKVRGVTVVVVISGSSPPAVGVSGSVITVTSQSSGTGALALAAILASTDAMALLTSAALASGSDGTGTLSGVSSTPLPFGSTGTVTVSGSPLDTYQTRVKVLSRGTLNTATFAHSLDAGNSYSGTYTVPLSGTFAIPGTGLTLTFTAGAGPVYFDAGDLHAFLAAGPTFTNSDLQAALAALLLDPRTWGFCHVIGAITPTIFASLGATADAFENARRFILIVAEVAGVAPGTPNSTWLADLLSTWGTYGHKRLALCAGDEWITSTLLSPLGGRTVQRNVAWSLTARAGSRPISEDLGRANTGPYSGVVRFDQNDVADSLLDARFSTLYTVPDYTGFYGGGRMFSPLNSDFRDWQDLRVLNEAMRIGYQGQTKYLSDTVRPRLVAQDQYPAGSIDPGDALGIEDYLNGLLRDNCVRSNPQIAASATATVDRTSVITGSGGSANTLNVKYDVTTLVTLKKISGVAGLKNPAIALGS